MGLSREQEAFALSNLFSDVLFVDVYRFKVEVVEHGSEHAKGAARIFGRDQCGEEQREAVEERFVRGWISQCERQNGRDEVERDEEVGDAEDGSDGEADEPFVERLCFFKARSGALGSVDVYPAHFVRLWRYIVIMEEDGSLCR